MQETSSAQKSDYYVSLDSLAYIWLSNDPNAFLPPVNRARLALTRFHNPTVRIFLTYSQDKLNKVAEMELLEFCAQFSITPLSLESDLKPRCRYGNDKAIMRHILTEIKLWNKGSGGNPAAASDMIRLLSFFLADYGTYVDFDVNVNLKEQANAMIKVDAPMIVPINFDWTCNDVLMIARRLDGTPHPDSMALVSKLQEVLLKRLTYFHISIAQYPESDCLKYYLKAFASIPANNAKSPTIYGYRRFIEKYAHNFFKADPENLKSADEQLEIWLHKNHVRSVVYVTGPEIFETLRTTFQQEVQRFSLENPKYDLAQLIKRPDLDHTTTNSDISWTPTGKVWFKSKNDTLKMIVKALTPKDKETCLAQRAIKKWQEFARSHVEKQLAI